MIKETDWEQIMEDQEIGFVFCLGDRTSVKISEFHDQINPFPSKDFFTLLYLAHISPQPQGAAHPLLPLSFYL